MVAIVAPPTIEEVPDPVDTVREVRSEAVLTGSVDTCGNTSHSTPACSRAEQTFSLHSPTFLVSDPVMRQPGPQSLYHV